MLDYKLLQALAAVLEHGGFEKAATALHLTQSAVSQRIRQLEDRMGTALVVRTSPVAPTEAGARLLAHYHQVKLLEDDLMGGLETAGYGGKADRRTPISLPLAVNADSLATWLLDALTPMLTDHTILLDIRVADQDKTHALLRTGEVVGCISSHKGPFQGCSSVSLGTMRYRCCASPEFIRTWFPEGITCEALQYAPAVTYDRDDELQVKVAQALHRTAATHNAYQQAPNTPAEAKNGNLLVSPSPSTVTVQPPTHYLPDSHIFVEFCVRGLGYGMLPEYQIVSHLKEGRLVDMAQEHAIDVPLFWHHWNLHTPIMKSITDAICKHTGDIFASD